MTFENESCNCSRINMSERITHVTQMFKGGSFMLQLWLKAAVTASLQTLGLETTSIRSHEMACLFISQREGARARSGAERVRGNAEVMTED